MMREMDQIGLTLCDIQGKIYEQSLIQQECSSSIFIRRFMYSSFVKRMDNLSFLNETLTVDDVLIEIEKEYGKSTYGKVKFSNNEMYWIGYFYRYFSYCYKIDSKRAYKIIKGNELQKLYYAYHTLDTMNAIDRVLEAKQIKLNLTNEEMIKEGVKILRRIKKNSAK